MPRFTPLPNHIPLLITMPLHVCRMPLHTTLRTTLLTTLHTQFSTPIRPLESDPACFVCFFVFITLNVKQIQLCPALPYALTHICGEWYVMGVQARGPVRVRAADENIQTRNGALRGRSVRVLFFFGLLLVGLGPVCESFSKHTEHLSILEVFAISPNSLHTYITLLSVLFPVFEVSKRTSLS